MSEIELLKQQGKLPIPTLENMRTIYAGLPKEWNRQHFINVTLRYNDTIYKDVATPTAENVFSNVSFGKNQVLFEQLTDMTRYVVERDGIFYAKRNEGIYFLHKSGKTISLKNVPDIFNIKVFNGTLTAYKFIKLEQIEWNQHYECNGGYDEKWEDVYNIVSEKFTFRYQDVIDYIDYIEKNT